MLKFIPLILFSVLLNASAQLALKKGMMSLGELNLSVAFVIKGVLNPFILAGLGFYAVSIVSWLIVLAKVNVSLAYPFLSVGFVFSAYESEKYALNLDANLCQNFTQNAKNLHENLGENLSQILHIKFCRFSQKNSYENFSRDDARGEFSRNDANFATTQKISAF